MSPTQGVPFRPEPRGRGLEQVGTGLDLRLGDQQAQRGPRVRRHLRAVVRIGESWHADCLCGWFSLPEGTSEGASSLPCAIEIEEALSLARRVRYREGHTG